MSNYYQPDPTVEHFEEQTDEWHLHGGNEPEPQAAHGEVSPRLISIGLLVSFAGMFVIIGILAWMFNVVNDQEKAAKLEVDSGRDYVSYVTQTQAELNTVGWVDEKAGTIRAPIDLAMKDVVGWYEKNQGAPGAPAKPQGKK